jgi:hypothetical protein
MKGFVGVFAPGFWPKIREAFIPLAAPQRLKTIVPPWMRGDFRAVEEIALFLYKDGEHSLRSHHV